MALPGVAPVSVPSVGDCPWSLPPPRGWPPSSEAVAGLRRNQWPEWIGITGRFASEYAVIVRITRNAQPVKLNSECPHPPWYPRSPAEAGSITPWGARGAHRHESVLALSVWDRGLGRATS